LAVLRVKPDADTCSVERPRCGLGDLPQRAVEDAAVNRWPFGQVDDELVLPAHTGVRLAKEGVEVSGSQPDDFGFRQGLSNITARPASGPSGHLLPRRGRRTLNSLGMWGYRRCGHSHTASLSAWRER